MVLFVLKLIKFVPINVFLDFAFKFAFGDLLQLIFVYRLPEIF